MSSRASSPIAPRHTVHWALVIIIMILGHRVSSSSTSDPTTLQSPRNASMIPSVTREYVVFSGNTTKETNEIRYELQNILGSGKVAEYGGPYTGPQMWLVKLTKGQIGRLLISNPGAEVYENVLVAERLTPNASISRFFPSKISNTDTYVSDEPRIVYQEDAPPDLKVVSWPKDRNIHDNVNLKYYAYNRNGGQRSVVYLVENGLDLRSPEFAYNDIRWLYSPSASATETDDDYHDHGTCVASKAVGLRLGVSKETMVIIVKSMLSFSEVIWALTRIINDLGAHPGRRAVVVLAFGSILQVDPPYHLVAQPWRRYQDLLHEAILRDAIIVVPSGNSRRGSYRQLIDQIPALFATSAMGALPLTLVGAVDDSGIEAPFSQQSAYINAWAPGVDAECAKFGQTLKESGTSVSVGLVAGLAAYFLGFEIPPFPIGGGRTAYNFNDFLKSTASWQRSSQGVPNVLWNLQDGSSMDLYKNTSGSTMLSKVDAT